MEKDVTKSNAVILLFIAACGGSTATNTVSPAPTADPIPMTEAEPAVQTSSEPIAPTKPTERAEPEPVAPEPATVKADLLAAERAAYEKAKPVFDKWCAKCHTKGGKMAAAKKLDHFDMTVYPFGGHHALELGTQLRTSLGIDGSKPTMPFDKKGAVKGEELALIAAWADAFDAAHEGGAHDGPAGHGHEH